MPLAVLLAPRPLEAQRGGLGFAPQLLQAFAPPDVPHPLVLALPAQGKVGLGLGEGGILERLHAVDVPVVVQVEGLGLVVDVKHEVAGLGLLLAFVARLVDDEGVLGGAALQLLLQGGLRLRAGRLLGRLAVLGLGGGLRRRLLRDRVGGSLGRGPALALLLLQLEGRTLGRLYQLALLRVLLGLLELGLDLPGLLGEVADQELLLGVRGPGLEGLQDVQVLQTILVRFVLGLVPRPLTLARVRGIRLEGVALAP